MQDNCREKLVQVNERLDYSLSWPLNRKLQNAKTSSLSCLHTTNHTFALNLHGSKCFPYLQEEKFPKSSFIFLGPIFLDKIQNHAVSGHVKNSVDGQSFQPCREITHQSLSSACPELNFGSSHWSLSTLLLGLCVFGIVSLCVLRQKTLAISRTCFSFYDPLCARPFWKGLLSPSPLNKSLFMG